MTASLATRRAHLLLERDLIDAGGGGAVWLMGSTMAETPETAPGSAPLAIVALAFPSCSLHATDAAMVLVPVQGHAAVSGVVTWVRFVNGSGNVVRDLPAGAPGSGHAVVVSNGQEPPSAQVWAGGEVNVTASFSVG